MLGYCGTGYNGMQVQNDPNVKTIEKDVYEAMVKAGAISKENSTDLKNHNFKELQELIKVFMLLVMLFH